MTNTSLLVLELHGSQGMPALMEALRVNFSLLTLEVNCESEFDAEMETLLERNRAFARAGQADTKPALQPGERVGELVAQGERGTVQSGRENRGGGGGKAGCVCA
eukprot:m.76802 g.76802  ORF g.76802 m.76802 type:complete len:105 (-) comp13193_c0_seq2:33-347(-)